MPQSVKTFPGPAVGTDFTITVPSLAGTNISSTTNGTTTLTSAALFGSVFPGMQISGTGIQAGTTVQSIASPSSLTLTLAATDSTTGNRLFFSDLSFWYLTAVHVKLVTDATVATRVPKFIIDDGTNTVMALSDPGQAASTTTEYNFMEGATLPANATNVNVIRIFPIPGDLMLKPGWRFRVSTALIQTGDQFSEIVLVVQQFSSDITPSFMLGVR